MVHKANRYLEKQKNRIDKHLHAGNYNKALKIWIVLFQRSRFYSLYALHRVYKSWYVDWDVGQILNLLKRVDRIRRSWDYNAIYDRIYIPKPTGSTWEGATGIRPLGVPNQEWRIILKMINDILYMIIEPCIDQSQTGFRPHMSYEDAWKIIIQRIKAGKKMYEFDLKACFNRISIDTIMDWFRLKGVYPAFSNYLADLIKTNPRIDLDYLDKPILVGGKEVVPSSVDNEMVRYYPEEYISAINPGPFGILPNIPFRMVWDPNHRNLVLSEEDRRIIFKFGLPQGWAISPLLSILVIDLAMKFLKLDVVMYADDGIVFHDGDFDPKTFSKVHSFGLELSDGYKKDGRPKCSEVSEELTFLGIKMHIPSLSFYTSEGLISCEDERVWEILKKDRSGVEFEEHSRFGKRAIPMKDWSWNIGPSSWLIRCFPILSFINFRHFIAWITGPRMYFLIPGLNWIVRWGWRESIKRMGILFLPISKISTVAMNDLILYLPRSFHLNKWFRALHLEKVEINHHYSDNTSRIQNRTVYSMKSFWAIKAYELSHYGQLIPRVDPKDPIRPIQMEDVVGPISNSLADPRTLKDLELRIKSYLIDRSGDDDKRNKPDNYRYIYLNRLDAQLRHIMPSIPHPILVRSKRFMDKVMRYHNIVMALLNRPLDIDYYIRRLGILVRFSRPLLLDKYCPLFSMFLGFTIVSLLLYRLERLDRPTEYIIIVREAMPEIESSDPSSSLLWWVSCALLVLAIGLASYYLFSRPSSLEIPPFCNEDSLYSGFQTKIDLIRTEYLSPNREFHTVIQEMKRLRSMLSELQTRLVDSSLREVQNSEIISNQARQIEEISAKLSSYRETLSRTIGSDNERMTFLQNQLNDMTNKFDALRNTLTHSGIEVNMDEFNNFLVANHELVRNLDRLKNLSEEELLVLRNNFLDLGVDFSSFLEDENLLEFRDVIDILREFILTNELLITFQ